MQIKLLKHTLSAERSYGVNLSHKIVDCSGNLPTFLVWSGVVCFPDTLSSSDGVVSTDTISEQ